MHKNIIINRYKKPNIIKDCINFLRKIKKFKLFLIRFNKNSNIRFKVNFFNYIVGSKNSQLIIIIIYNKYIFSTNNKI